MKSIKERRLEFLEDTIEYYSSDPINKRSFFYSTNDEACYYRSPEGKKCAIGRHISDNKYNKSMEEKNLFGILDYSPDSLPKEILELDIYFLFEIQILHDKSEFWDNNGLTVEGLEFVNLIKKSFIN